MRKVHFLLSILLLLPLVAMAQWRTADEALNLLNGSVSNRRMAQRTAPDIKCSRLLHTIQKDGHNTIYIFQRSQHGGVVLMSGFEGADVLGYTDQGGFNIDSIAPGLQFLLDDYSHQMLQAQKQWNTETAEKVRLARQAQEQSWYQPIEPLIQTHWNQWAPFDSYVPVGCPTGCVATMMAQLMKYYNYPTRGTGSHSYQWNGQTLSANFGATTYNWEKMLDKYNADCYTSEQASNVAMLMYHCGVAVDMNYAPGGSGASSFDAMRSMSTYFGYNPSATYTAYQGTEAARLQLYNQLAASYPVPISGHNGIDGGHAFILDGYKNGLFHANFGWGGTSDGYYAIDDVVPGLHVEYFYGKDIILNLYPKGSYTHDTAGEDGEFTITQPGTLRQMLGTKRYRKLTLHGSINGADLRELRARCGCHDYGYYPTVQGLTSLDLSDVQIVDGGTYCILRYSDNTGREYKAKANTLGYSTFSYSFLKELCLPATVQVLQSSSFFQNNSLEYLLLPRDLTTYEDGALYIDAQGTQAENLIHLPEGCKAAMKDGALYTDDYRRLCLVTGQHDLFQPDDRCEDVAYGAFYCAGCQVGTVVVPRTKSTFSAWGETVKRWWLGEGVRSLDIETYETGTPDIDLYLFSDQMATLHYLSSDASQRVRNIYVPRKLVSIYRANTDKWTLFGSRIRAIEDANICIDDRHVSLPSTTSMMTNVSAKLPVTFYDTNLYGKQQAWTSSNTSVATVDSDGHINALSAGQTTITLRIGSYAATCQLTVENWPEVHVDVPGTLPSLLRGMNVEMLRVTGQINGEDLRELRALCGCNDKDFVPQSAMHIRGLDLSDANIVDGGVYYLGGREYTAKKDELGYMSFSNSKILNTLILPNSVQKISSTAIWYCSELNSITLPTQMSSYNSGIAYTGNGDLNVVVPPTSCLVQEPEGIYSRDYNNLYIVKPGHSSKIFLNPLCKRMDYYAFTNGESKVDTLVASNIQYLGNLNGHVNDVLWLGIKDGVLSPSYIYNPALKLFLPDNKVAKLDDNPATDNWQSVYVPGSLLDAYKADARWAVVADRLFSIDDCDVVLDPRRVILPSDIELMANTINDVSDLGVSILDTKLLNAELIWSTNNADVLSVSDDGVLTAHIAGSATLTLKVGDVTRRCNVTVLPWPSVDVTDPGTLSTLLAEDAGPYLRVTGDINGDDLYCLRRLCGASDIGNDSYYITINPNPTLFYLDLTDANLHAGGVYAKFWDRDYTVARDNLLPNRLLAFAKLKYITFPRTSTANTNTVVLYMNQSLNYVELPDELAQLFPDFVDRCDNLRYLVYRGTRFMPLTVVHPRMSGVTLYVPSALLLQFRSDANYAASFLAIEPLEDSIIPTGIDAVPADRAYDNLSPSDTLWGTSAPIYNLHGQRLTHPQRGINLLRGRKVLVR